jgi:trans-aconitate 2-methyltransferase
MAAFDWNATSYDTISAPQQAWGATVVERLALEGNETVLDAGAGTGRVTDLVLERLPHGHVIAVDGSPAMCERARERLPAERTTVICSDLLALELPDRVDAIISTATFHWILDHDALFARMRALVRGGGQFIAQCGGSGNIAAVRAAADAVAASEPFAAHLAGMREVWNFATPQDTRTALERAGFAVSAIWLAPAPATPPRPREFLETSVLPLLLDELPAQLRDPFLDELMERLGDEPVLDYVRLNWDATARPA